MLYLIYHDPNVPEQMAIEPIYPWSNPIIAHLISYQQIVRYSRCKKAIKVKTCNLVVIESNLLDRTMFPTYPCLLQVANNARLAGKLHEFDLEDYPELFI